MSSRENILREFRHLSESDLMIEIQTELTKFMILTKSEEEATKILEKYGKKAYFDFNDWKKVRYYRLMTCARLMNLVIPTEWYNVQITDDDVIERMIEFRNDEIKLVNENSYLYDSCHVDEIDDLIDIGYGDLPSDLEIDKIRNFYFDMIKKEFGNYKKLVK